MNKKFSGFKVKVNGSVIHETAYSRISSLDAQLALAFEAYAWETVIETFLPMSIFLRFQSHRLSYFIVSRVPVHWF